MLYSQYLLNKLLSISAHIVDSVPVHSEVSLKCFMLFQQALLKRKVSLIFIETHHPLLVKKTTDFLLCNLDCSVCH